MLLSPSGMEIHLPTHTHTHFLIYLMSKTRNKVPGVPSLPLLLAETSKFFPQTIGLELLLEQAREKNQYSLFHLGSQVIYSLMER